MLLTFILATMGWILFRSDSIEEAFEYYGLMFGNLFDGQPATITSQLDAWLLTVALVLMTVVEWCNRDKAHEFARLPHNRILRWGLYILIIFMIGAYMVTNEMPFIYFQF